MTNIIGSLAVGIGSAVAASALGYHMNDVQWWAIFVLFYLAWKLITALME
jgi:hypothetical protein